MPVSQVTAWLSSRLAGRIAGGRHGRFSRVLDQSRGESVGEGLLGGEGPRRVGQLTDHVLARQMTHELCPSHVRHQAPFRLNYR
jgi:hypothetical protein